MKIKDIADILNAEIVCGFNEINREANYCFASDLMSDVLTIDKDNLLLITGLSNLQTIRTAEMSDIFAIIFARNKEITEEMKKLAEDNNMVLLKCKYSMFKTSGILYKNGINPVY
ncbi:MAG: hypothetical protein J7J86_01685 [Bacteroidales bacterium]|nr:hypothetical protein [Bacteroidales bacterium]